MFKPTILKIVLTIVLGGGFFLLAINAHMDVFPCTKAYYSYQDQRLEPKTASMCSLLAVKRSGERSDSDFAELTGGGYAVGALLFVLLPYFVASIIGPMMRRSGRGS
jgi:hypothetical protein